MVTASQVKDLREKTGAGMMDCKKVLTETDGDMEKAIELLRERGTQTCLCCGNTSKGKALSYPRRGTYAL